MADLWGVVIGGVLAVTGSAATQWYLHAAKTADERRKLRDQKLEEAIGLVYEHADWMERLRRISIFGQDERETISPLAKINAIAAIHFPEVYPAIQKFEQATNEYQLWMIARGKARLAESSEPLSEGFDDVYARYLSAKRKLVDELKSFAPRL